MDAWAALAAYPDLAAPRDKLRDFILTYRQAENRIVVQQGNGWAENNSELHAWACLCGIAPDLLSMNYTTNFLVTVTSEMTGRELTGFAFCIEDVPQGRLEIAPTIEIAATYYALGDDRQGDHWLREVEKAILDSTLYPGTKGFSFIANKTRWPNDPADLKKISPHACAWYVFACEKFNPYLVGPGSARHRRTAYSTPTR